MRHEQIIQLAAWKYADALLSFRRERLSKYKDRWTEGFYCGLADSAKFILRNLLSEAHPLERFIAGQEIAKTIKNFKAANGGAL